MGNRFRDVAGYHSIIKAHGVIAAITFLGIVPGAILIARFYSPNPHFARRLHIWMQVLTVLLSTVVFVLGWFAVGRQRSLTNPHHGIGLAIYILIIAQMFWGWFMHKRRGHRRPHIPLKVMVSNGDTRIYTYVFASVDGSVLTGSVAPLAGTYHCSSWYRSDTARPYLVWLSQVALHPLHIGYVRAGSRLFYSHLSSRTSPWRRLRYSRQLFVRPRSDR